MAQASMNAIKTRIKSVTGTMQITKAMELVATSKLRRAKERAENSRPYHYALKKAIKDIRSFASTAESVYGEIRENPKTCYVVIAGDRGLAGGFNNNIFRLVSSELQVRQNRGETACFLPVGRKAIEYYRHIGAEIITDEFEYASEIGPRESFLIADIVTELFKQKRIDRVELVYTKFKSILSQEPVHVRLLPLKPLTKQKDLENAPKGEPLYEGDPDEMLDVVVPRYVGGSIYIAASESLASECAARRNAMNSANKNAEEMIDDLTLRYNRARQGVITQEITEIISGAEML